MIYIIKFIVTILSLILLFSVPIHALDNQGGRGYSWFCVHRKDNLQPSCDPSFSFIDKYDGFYIDKAHGDECDDKVVYLTFDVGYGNENVERILDTLKNEEVIGAFFILGNMLSAHSDLVKRMHDEGHLVCNHTYSHKTMVCRSEEEFAAELNKLDDAYFAISGKHLSKYYRPPEGRFDEASLEYAQKMGYKTVFWSFAYADWDNNKQMSSDKARTKILENIHNGEIMLLHPTSSTNATILPEIIQELKRRGFRFGSLDEL